VQTLAIGGVKPLPRRRQYGILLESALLGVKDLTGGRGVCYKNGDAARRAALQETVCNDCTS
jgi:hypothetical protein